MRWGPISLLSDLLDDDRRMSARYTAGMIEMDAPSTKIGADNLGSGVVAKARDRIRVPSKVGQYAQDVAARAAGVRLEGRRGFCTHDEVERDQPRPKHGWLRWAFRVLRARVFRRFGRPNHLDFSGPDRHRLTPWKAETCSLYDLRMRAARPERGDDGYSHRKRPFRGRSLFR
jgi:hypothetical protein